MTSNVKTYSKSLRWNLPGLTDPKSPAYERPEVTDMRCRFWELTEDLKGGTEQMRAATTRWLPKEPKEHDDSYNTRLSRSFLWDRYTDAIDKAVSKPFSKGVTIDESVKDPKILKAIEDISLQDFDISKFGSELFTKGLDDGLVHVLTDYPRSSTEATKADEEELDFKPYAKVISAKDVLNWKSEAMQNGKQVLTQVSFLQEAEYSSEGGFGASVTYRIITLTRTEATTYILNTESKEWELEDTIPHTFGSIPFRTYYFKRTGFMTAEPVFKQVANLNLAHWQSYSDQRNILRFARTGVYSAMGFTQEEAGGIAIGPTSVVSNSKADAKFDVVEYKGDSVKLGQEDLNNLEKEMDIQSLQPLVSKSGTITATETAVGEAKSSTQLHSWASDLSDIFTQVVKDLYRWLRLEPPEGQLVKVFNDFSIGSKGIDSIKLLLEQRKSKELDRKTLLEEEKRAGILSEEVDIDEILAALENEGPDLNLIGSAFSSELKNNTTSDDEDEEDEETNNQEDD